MSATDILWMVYYLLPSAFFADLLILPLGLWWVRRWRKVRREARCRAAAHE